MILGQRVRMRWDALSAVPDAAAAQKDCAGDRWVIDHSQFSLSMLGTRGWGESVPACTLVSELWNPTGRSLSHQLSRDLRLPPAWLPVGTSLCWASCLRLCGPCYLFIYCHQLGTFRWNVFACCWKLKCKNQIHFPVVGNLHHLMPLFLKCARQLCSC